MSQDDQCSSEQRAYCYLTLNVSDGVDIFIKPVFKQIIAESLNYFVAKKGLLVHGWCLMTNHLHLIARARDGVWLRSLAKEFKEFTSKIIMDDIDAESDVRKTWIVRKFKDAGRPFRFGTPLVWQEGDNRIYIDRKNIDVLSEHLKHIHNHPVRDRIVDKAEDYLYSSARDYAGMKGLVQVCMIRENYGSNFILRHISSY